MSKGLDAFKIIKDSLVEIDYENEEDVKLDTYIHEEELDIIEKELKRLEEYDKTEYSALIERYKELLKEKKANEKKLKALEVIKNKIVLIDVFVESINADDYNEFLAKSKDRHLTQEEHDLLKEVLK